MADKMEPHNYLEISRQALYRNALTIQNAVHVPVIGVVKCDGYGLSIPEAARVWQSVGVNLFAVATPDEAVALRQAGFREDILLMTPVSGIETLQVMVRFGVILTVTSPASARFYSQWSRDDQPLRVHVAVDTGMGRFGVRWTDMPQLREIYQTEGLSFEGIFSHFACSFEKTYRKTRLQLERFLKVTGSLSAQGIRPGIRHIANSCAALRFPETHLDAVRIGSALVGRLCVPVDVELEPVATLQAQVVDVKILCPGDTTGYASVCKVRQLTRAVVVAVGEADGFGILGSPDNLPVWDGLAWLKNLLIRRKHPPAVEFQNHSLPLVGRVGSQYTLFDAGDAPIHPGDYVTAPARLLFPARHRRFL